MLRRFLLYGLTKQQIEARVWEHNEGICDGYTKKRRPVRLVFTETYDRVTDAIERERQIKGWSRAKKEALIALDYEKLPELSKKPAGCLSPAPSWFDKLTMRAVAALFSTIGLAG